MNRIGRSVFLVILTALMTVAASAADSKGEMFNIDEILDQSTLDTKILQDWHVDEVTGTTRQKLIEINVAEWWPGQDYRIPVRMIVPLEGKAKGFSITGANPYETLMKDSQPTDFQAKLLAGGVGIVKTHVKAPRQIPGKQGLEQKMGRVFLEDLNPRYTTIWIWSMTLMRATTAAYAEGDHFEKGKVAGSGNSKNGISPAVALINDERFTATCSDQAFAYYSPTRRADREEMAKVDAANKAFLEAVKAGDIDLDQKRAKWYQSVMVGSERSMDKIALKAGRSMDEMQNFADCLWSSLCVTENWDRLMERGVDILFQPGTHDYVAFDVPWGAQNHPQLPVYYEPNGGHQQKPHGAAAKDSENRSAFLWNHFFGGESSLKPPTSSHKVDKDKLSVSVSFNEGPQPISGRIWWIYDRAPAGSAPFLHVQIPEDQWMDMECDAKTGAWTATIPLKDGVERIDFFSNHGHMANGYKQYLSSPYTRVELSPAFASNALSEEVRPGVFRTPDEQFEKLHVVLLADEKDHGPAGNGLHDYPLWQKRWALLLGGEEASEEKQVNLIGPPEKDRDYRKGMPNVAVSCAWHWPSEEQFQTADVIVAYCYLEWTDERLGQVRRYLEGGGGLVLIHSATWTKPKPSCEVADLIGVGGFELFRHGDVRLKMLAPEHPICAGLPETIILKDDETYWPPTPIMEGVTVLATSVEDKAKRGSTPRAAQPMFWCYELGEGRVFGCVPGHSAHTFDDPLFRKLLFQGMAWTARENPLVFDEVLSKTGIGEP